MGYTHYWRATTTKITDQQWDNILTGVRTLAQRAAHRLKNWKR